MPSSFVRVQHLAFLGAVALAFVLQSLASTQAPSLEVFYERLEPKASFKYTWKGNPGTCNVGVFCWEIPQTEFGTNGLDRSFTGYCAEILVPITEGKHYRFRMNSLLDVSNYDDLKEMMDTDRAEVAAQKREVDIKELFGRYFKDPIRNAVNSDEALALQVALWEVVQETEPAEASPKLDLFAGDFQANYPKSEAPASVATAQRSLASLTGADAVFYANPDLRGRELVRLQGIA